MATGKISKRSVEAFRSDQSDSFLWDDELRGFGLKCTAKGAKSYIVQYRLGGRGSPTRRYTIGRHGTYTPLTARAEAQRLLVLVAQGKDPRREQALSQRQSVELAFDAYAERFLSDYGRRRWRARTHASVESNFRRYVIPQLGKTPLTVIGRRDIVAVLDGLPDRKPALPRNVFAQTRKLFSWAVERGDLERSPFEGLRSPPAVPSRDRVLTDEELQCVWSASRELGYPFGPMLRLLLFTAQRREEVGAMDWKELRRRTREWTLGGARTKNGKATVVPLNDLAVQELDQIADGTDWPTSGLVFSTTGKTPVSGYSKAKRRLDKLLSEAGATMRDWRFHDLRRTIATNLQRLGTRFEVTEALLNHSGTSRSGVAAVYQRYDWALEKRKGMDDWGSHLIALSHR